MQGEAVRYEACDAIMRGVRYEACDARRGVRCNARRTMQWLKAWFGEWFKAWRTWKVTVILRALNSGCEPHRKPRAARAESR